MRVTHPYLCMLLVTAVLGVLPATAQQRRFEIGGAGVYGNMRYRVPNDTWGSWAADTAARGSTDPTAIPTERWEQLQDLGLTMAHFTIFSERLVEGPENVARKLNHAAWVRGLSLSLSDPVLWELSRSERRLYHPESQDDFTERRGGEVTFSTVLHDPSTNDDRQDTQRGGSNAVRFRMGIDDGATLAGWQRGGEIFAELEGRNSSGYYVLSVRCAVRPMELPAGDSEVFGIVIASSTGSTRFPCTAGMLRRASQLHATGNASTDTSGDTLVVEVLLGRFHVEGVVEDDAVVLSIERKEVPGPDPGFNERTRAHERMQMELRYHGVADLAIDAIVLSDERAFAFFNNGHPDLKRGEESLASDVRRRMRLLGADSTADWPALRYLEFSESLAEDGSDVPARAMAVMLRDMAGDERIPVRPFVWASGAATKDPVRIARSVASMRGLVSGRYVYPFEESFGVRPADAAYYDSTYFPVPHEAGGRHTWTNFQSYSDWFRQYSEARRAFGIDEWMPAMQTHSWQFRNGWPVAALADTVWLYEPSAAEFRFQCNLALCYGATGLMLYQISTWPGRARKENITDLRDPEYGDMGAVGLLDPHSNQPRRRDTNGEDKWDSTRTFLRECLRPHGELLSRMRWIRGYDLHRQPVGQGRHVLSVSTWFDTENGSRIDELSHRFIEIGEFIDTEGSIYLFVVNKRVDPAGTRHIGLTLRDATQKLELIPLASNPVSLEYAGEGAPVLTIQPGHAALLRLRPPD